MSNVEIDEESFELATAHATATIVQTCPSVGFARLISSAPSLYILSKRFAYPRRFVQSLESVPS